MRSILKTVLVGGIVLLGASSCATMSKQPLTSGEVRLLSIDVVGAGVEGNSSFAVNVFFESGGKPAIKKACFYESGARPFCFEGSDLSFLTLGTKTAFQVHLPGLDIGSHRVECYAEYTRDGETRKTNVVSTHITAGGAPGP